MFVVARTRRHCLRLYDIENFYTKKITLDELIKKIEFTYMETAKELLSKKPSHYFREIALDLLKEYSLIMQKIGEFSVDYTAFLNNIKDNSKVLIEGCNGIMLDNLHGLNPYTTSAQHQLMLLWMVQIFHHIIFAIHILYVLDISVVLYMNNNEVDNAKGMTRRISWFDLPTLRRALTVHKGSKLIINKLDIMKNLKKVKICTQYLLKNGKKLKYMPDNIEELKEAIIIYKEFSGWGDISSATTKNILPNELLYFLSFFVMAGIEMHW